jgi:hypothetical protein
MLTVPAYSLLVSLSGECRMFPPARHGKIAMVGRSMFGGIMFVHFLTLRATLLFSRSYFTIISPTIAHCSYSIGGVITSGTSVPVVPYASANTETECIFAVCKELNPCNAGRATIQRDGAWIKEKWTTLRGSQNNQYTLSS